MTKKEEDIVEIRYINELYDEEGFDGVMEYAKSKLGESGFVGEVKDGLYVIVAGSGRSDHKHWIKCCLNSFPSNMYSHYQGFMGDAIYYTRDPDASLEIRVKKDKGVE